jgi:hypothetical protein
MTKAQRQAAKPRVGMCINCGDLVNCNPKTTDNELLICSRECLAQFRDFTSQLDDEGNIAVSEIGDFTSKWPNVSTDDFMHIVAISQRMEAKYPTVWPFLIEYHSDKGCWHYARKGAAKHFH